MMMKHHQLPLILTLVLGIGLGSRPLPAQAGQPLLDRMSARYRALSPCVLSFEIVQYYDRNATDYQSSLGSFYIAGPRKFRVDFIDQELIYDGEWLWSYDRPNGQLIIEALDPQSSLKFIFDMLLGNWENFRVVSVEAPKGGETISLGLKTRDDNDYFNAIFLKIQRESGLLQSATYLDFNRLKTVIEFSDPKRIQTAVAAILFDTQRLNAKELIDLRP